MRIAGAAFGLALLFGAVAVVLTAPEPRAALGLAARGDPRLLALLALLVLGSILATAAVFRGLLLRFGRVGRLEMTELIAASTLLNFVPLRPGLLGRVGWHAVVHSIPASRSAQTIGESIALGAACIGCVVIAVLVSSGVEALPRGGLVALAAFAPVVPALAVASLRHFAVPAVARAVDMLLWGGRYLIAFHLVGAPIDFPAAMALAAAACAASLIPLAGNGLGLREWTTGLLAPAVAGVGVDAGLAADLLIRGIELVTVLPVGVLAIVSLLRRARRFRAGR